MTKKIDPAKLSMVQLEHSYKEALAVSKRYKAELDELKTEIERRIKPLANDYGTFNRELDGCNLKIVKSKNIAWDSDRLEELYEQIKTDGADPTVYIKKKYLSSVSPHNICAT